MWPDAEGEVRGEGLEPIYRSAPQAARAAPRLYRLLVPHALLRDPKFAADVGYTTALTHGMTVVTRNVADFEPLGAPLLNPWDSA